MIPSSHYPLPYQQLGPKLTVFVIVRLERPIVDSFLASCFRVQDSKRPITTAGEVAVIGLDSVAYFSLCPWRFTTIACLPARVGQPDY